ncbi:MAG: alpha/beta hydrolase, partial [Anaerolineae bacterium]
LKERDLIVFDPRGTGSSEPKLDCWEFAILYLRDLEQGFTDEEKESYYGDALTMCRDRLVSAGVNPAAYTSAANAADVQDILIVLGYEQANLYGVSYGTRLAQNIMRDFPAIVRSAVLDSVVPFQIKLYNEVAARGNVALRVLFDACAADPECHAAYPDLERVFHDLVAQLDAAPVTVEVTNPFDEQTHDVAVNGSAFSNAALWALRWPDYISLVPQAIYQVHDGDYSLLRFALNLPMTAFSDLSLGTMISTSCHEHVFATTPQELEKELAVYPSTEAMGLSIINGNGEVLFSLCEAWGATPFDPRDDEPLVSDIPTLILTGEYDPTTPPIFGQRVAETLGQGHFFEFPGQGHAPSFDPSQSCPLDMALAFLDDPTIPPDDACIAEMSQLQFVISFRGAQDVEFELFTDQEREIKGIIPKGWKAAGQGFYNRLNSILDPTQVGAQGAPVSAEVWVQWLADEFQYTGLDETPQLAGERQANDFTWQLYVSTFKGNPVDIALAETQARTLLVVLLSTEYEHDAMYEAIYLPMMDALLPIEAVTP